MPNKKYIDFPAGTYDTNKIFLQADPITGALEKINLPTIQNLTGTPGRIIIASSAIDISATYIGQNTIDTLGTITTGTWQATVIAPTKGGTGISSYATGDILYASAANILSKLAATTNGYVLTLAAGLPVWAAASGGSTSPAGSTSQVQYNDAGAFGASATFTYSPTVTASGALGRAMLINPTVTAAANNDVLVGLDVSGTLNTAGFTGVTKYSARFATGIRITSPDPDSCFIRFPNNGALRGLAASSGALYIDVSANLTGTIYLRATTVSLPAISPSSITTPSVTVSGNGALLTVTAAATSIAGIRITNQGSAATWFFENTRSAAAGTLEITNNIGGLGTALTLSPNRTVGCGVLNPNASAQLDVTSTTRGLLPPRMTTAQKIAITSPAEGLEVYDLTLKKKCLYTGTAWETITSV
jgi:hypothetical protein